MVVVSSSVAVEEEPNERYKTYEIRFRKVESLSFSLVYDSLLF